MSSPAERKLVFTLQPTNTIKATTIPPVQVAVLDSEGKVDISFTGNITISLDDEPIPLEAIIARPENSTPYRLRATAAGCVDGVSNVFYVLQPYQPNVIEVPATDGEPPPLMFHYTDRAGLIGIIQSKTVWATHIRYLNDSSEYSYTSNLALELAKSLSKEITDEREHRAFTAFQQNLSSLEFNTHYFVFSLSADGGDRLSQWRAYGKAADAYSLLRIDTLKRTLLENQ